MPKRTGEGEDTRHKIQVLKDSLREYLSCLYGYRNNWSLRVADESPGLEIVHPFWDLSWRIARDKQSVIPLVAAAALLILCAPHWHFTRQGACRGAAQNTRKGEGQTHGWTLPWEQETNPKLSSPLLVTGIQFSFSQYRLTLAHQK